MTVGAIQIDIDHIAYALEHDRAFAISFFLPDVIADGTPIPDIHIEALDLMMEDSDLPLALALPRDHAKTTLAKIATLLHILFKGSKFPLYAGATHTLAAQSALDIINFLEGENFTALHRAVCGADIKFAIKQESHGLFVFTLFPESHHAIFSEKQVIMRAVGAGQRIRGMNIRNTRPDFAIFDDIDAEENTDSEASYIKNKRWFYGPARKALNKFKHKIIQLGNLIANMCLIHDHINSKFWRSRRYGCLKSDGQPLWPEAWPLAKLKLDFEEYKSEGLIDVWFAEMMNMPIAIGRGLIKADEIYYRPRVQKEDVEFAFITIDPAISQRSWGHRTGIAVHGFVDPYWQIVDSRAEQGVDPIMLFDATIELCYRWGVTVVGIESVAYQAALKPMFEHLCLERHIFGITFVPLHATARKPERLAVWCAEIKRKAYALNDDDVMITSQLLQFDPQKRDNDCDLADAAAYGPQMTTRYMHIIMNTLPGGHHLPGMCEAASDFAEI